MEYTTPATAVQKLSLKGENDWSTANRLATSRLPSPPIVFSVSAVEQLKWGRCAYSKATRGAEGESGRGEDA